MRLKKAKKKKKKMLSQSENTGEAGNGLWSCPFSAFHDRPSWEICQSFENCSKHARNWLGTTSRSSSSQRFDSAKWIRFWSCWSLLSLLWPIFSAVMWSLRFPFFWSCVCHYTWFTTLRTRPVNGHCTFSSMPDLLALWRTFADKNNWK